MINKKRALDTFIEMAKLNSPSLNEREIADYLLNLFAEYECYEDLKAKEITGGTTGNIIVKIPGDENLEPLILCARMDRVEPGINIEPIFSDDQKYIISKNETILGADDLGGIAQIIELVRVLKENNLNHRPLELVFTIAEEIGLLGANNLDISKIKSKVALVIDNGDVLGEAIIGGPSYYKITGRVKGKAVHAGIEPEKGISSIQVVSNAISKLQLLRIDEFTTVNIGQVICDYPLNVVPEITTFGLEVRSLVDDYALKQVDKIIATFEEECSLFKAEFEYTKERLLEAYKLPDTNPVLEKFTNICLKKGIEVNKVVGGGGTDLSALNSNFGITGIVIATGGNNAHQVAESLNIDIFIKALENLLEFVIS